MDTESSSEEFETEEIAEAALIAKFLPEDTESSSQISIDKGGESSEEISSSGGDMDNEIDKISQKGETVSQLHERIKDILNGLHAIGQQMENCNLIRRKKNFSKKNLQEINSPSESRNVTCFGCNQKGHYMNECLRLKNNKSKTSKKKALKVT
ncbi:uncharacterized protein LOC122022945 [Zingiber officinale]|uniref:uncharacterized protein LOC122022945 n=1 Tax=Zingiber officinale TaxID=94328 RepID=UPI001C4C656A|nr:uncharacterized protein LOC122022945 [Zingiber officinale]